VHLPILLPYRHARIASNVRDSFYEKPQPVNAGVAAGGAIAGREKLVENLKGLGFAVVSVEDRWKFTHIRALKMEARPREGVERRF
jgi:hypothetical protein